MALTEADRQRNIIDAEARLAAMEFNEEIAQFHDEADCEIDRELFAETYRRIVGIHPDQRKRLKLRLECMLASGHRRLAEVIEDCSH